VEEIHEGHSLLVVVSANEWIGCEIIGSTLDSSGDIPLSVSDLAEDVLPSGMDPGLYVWTGRISIFPLAQRFDGKLRPARIDDLAYFGMRGLDPVPATVTDDDGEAD